MDEEEMLKDLEAQIEARSKELLGIESAAKAENRADKNLTADETKRCNDLVQSIKDLTTRKANLIVVRDARAAAALADGGNANSGSANKEGENRGANPRIQVINNGNEDKPFRSLGDFMEAVRRAGVGDRRDERFDIIQKAAEQRAAASGFNITMPSEGGIMLQSDQAAELLKTAAQGSVLFQYVKKVPLAQGSRYIKIPYRVDKDQSGGSVTGGLKWYSTSEAEAAQTSKFKMEKMSLELKKLTAGFYASDELMRNLPALVAMIEGGFKDELSVKLDKWIAYGNGNDEAVGVLTSANKALVVIAKESGQDADTIVYENVSKMDVYHVAGPQSQWLHSPAAQIQLDQMNLQVGMGGVPVYLPASGIVGQRGAGMYGKPLQKIMKPGLIKPLGDQGDLVLIDPAEYLWIDNGGPDFQSSVHVRFLQGEMTFKFTYEADGRPSWYDKLKLETGEEVSPYTVLQARA